jgi:hypothetical protein
MDNISDMDDKIFARIVHSASKKEKEAFERKRKNGDSDSSYLPGKINICLDVFDSSTGAKRLINGGSGACLVLVWFLHYSTE